MIILGIGANLAHPTFGIPRRTCGAALARIAKAPLVIENRSRWYASAPVVREQSASLETQPWYVNGAVTVATDMQPEQLLAHLLEIENAFGRRRSVPDAPRTLDLDILAFNEEIIDLPSLHVPHPRLHLRAFALLPMADLAPDWRHPVRQSTIAEMVAELGDEQHLSAMDDADGFMGTEWHEDASSG